MLCPICGSKMKDSFTETYCPNEPNHVITKTKKFKLLIDNPEGSNIPKGTIFVESEPPGDSHWQKPFYDDWYHRFGTILCLYSEQFDIFLIVNDLGGSIDWGYIEEVPQQGE